MYTVNKLLYFNCKSEDCETRIKALFLIDSEEHGPVHADFEAEFDSNDRDIDCTILTDKDVELEIDTQDLFNICFVDRSLKAESKVMTKELKQILNSCQYEEYN